MLLEVKADVVLAQLAQALVHVLVYLSVKIADLATHAAELILNRLHAVLHLALAREIKEAVALLLVLQLVQAAVDLFCLGNELLALEDLIGMSVQIALLNDLTMRLDLAVKRLALARIDTLTE